MLRTAIIILSFLLFESKSFSKDEIGKAIGYEKVLCVALLKSNLSQSLNQSLYKLNKFQMIK